MFRAGPNGLPCHPQATAPCFTLPARSENSAAPATRRDRPDPIEPDGGGRRLPAKLGQCVAVRPYAKAISPASYARFAELVWGIDCTLSPDANHSYKT